MFTIVFLLGATLSGPQFFEHSPEIQKIYDAGFNHPTDVAIIHMINQYVELEKIRYERIQLMPSCPDFSNIESTECV